MDNTPTERASLNTTVGILLAVLVGGGFYLYGKSMETGRMSDQNIATISVTGEGKMAGAPDIAQLSLGIQTGRQPTAKQATEMLGKNMQAVIEAVKKAGVAEKDIANQFVSLEPVYDYRNGSPNITGYQASQSLLIKVRELDKASAVLSAATGAGANQAGGVQFTIDDPEGLRAQARTKAIAQAKAKAEKLAEELGMDLGKIRGFSEDGGANPPMPYAARNMGGGGVAEAAMDSSIPLPQGEQELTVYVTITFELN